MVAGYGQLPQAADAPEILDNGIRLVGCDRFTPCTLEFLVDAATYGGELRVIRPPRLAATRHRRTTFFHCVIIC